ncbi:PGAP1 family protein [Fibrella aestuarina BUZ 2]|uniref:PGAP1 family protein n=1 Tax=Fibrella aestuarina BUZ 2 TaxID=1166018 RepID=I0KCU4_9BACT|nr:alpha/beta fold hydrolase [Fibrella aestuarina]CCH01947.1 PGAP1 family protein [Fibrella aestuarina BUZ 2]
MFRRLAFLWLLLIYGQPLIAQSFKIEHYHQLTNHTGFERQLINTTPFLFRVCADGSRASLFRVSGSPSGTPIPYLQTRLQVLDPDTLRYGRILTTSQSADYLEAEFRHPTVVDNNPVTTLQLVIGPPSATTAILSFSVLVGQAPLLMVHGLNSDNTIYTDMENQLITDLGPLAPSFLVRVDYGATSRAQFADNQQVIPHYIDATVAELKTRRVAAGKVDIIGHSMGGILSRLYLQSANYHDDIHKLITLNTPHGGSQMANFLFQPSANLALFVKALLVTGGYLFCNCGAFADLRVDSPAIRSDLNGIGLNNHKVPSHAIVTTKGALFNTPLPLKPLLTAAEYALAGMPLGDIFCGDESDWVVAKASQIGGLPQLTYSIVDPDQQHSGSTKNTSVIAKLKQLIIAPSTGPLFHKDGFSPPTLIYRQCEPLAGSASTGSQTQSSLIITQPRRGAYVKGGSSLTIATTGTNVSEIRTIISYSADSLYVGRELASATSQTISIDKRATRRVVVVLGKTPDGTYVSDSTYFYVSNNFCESFQSGAWTDAATWSCGHEPGPTDIAVLNQGHVVQITTNTAQANAVISQGGKLVYTNSSNRLRLRVEQP